MTKDSGAIRALAVRDWQITKTYPMTLILRYPLALVSIFTFFFISELIGEPAVSLGEFEATYFEFAIVGLLVSGVTTVATGALINTVRSEQTGGTLELLVGSPAGRIPVLMGLSATPALLALGDVAIYLLLGLMWLGSGFSLSGILALVPVLVLVWIVFAAFGVLSAGVTVMTKRGDPVGVLLTQLSSLLAGALFPVELLPTPLETLSFLIPTRYALDAIRTVLLGGEPVTSILPELGALFGFALVLVPISVGFFNWSIDTARRVGTLSTG